MDERSEQTEAIVRRDRVVVSAVVATYNEEEHIARCLQGLLAQEGVPGEIEILVIDGMSTDRTADVVRSFPEYGTRIRLLENPRRLQVFAWNAAIREARGEYFAMILAHAEYAPTYLASCLEVMRRTGAAAVGGVQRPIGRGALGRAIAWCMSSPVGMGGARFRYTDREEESDTVFSIFTRRTTLEALGGYDENIPFDEDSDLNYRLRRTGAKLVVSPRIRVRYYVRESFKALWKQMYRYGYWRRVTQMKHPGEVPLRVLAPPAFLAALALSVALGTTPLRWVSLVVPLLYAGLATIAGLLALGRARSSALLVPVALAVMHCAYGIGYWTALFTLRRSPGERPARTPAR